MGYYVVFMGIEYQHKVALKTKFNANEYDASQTVTFQIPLSVPYMSDNTEFESADGIFEHNGELYQLIKQKYAKDTLTVVCLKDDGNKRLHAVMADYLKTYSDASSEDGQSNEITLSFIKDYIPQTFALVANATGWQIDVAVNSFCQNLIPSFVASVVHPPERA